MLNQEDEIKRSFSGAPWEKKVGYCRAIRHGHLILVSGTAPVSEDGRVFMPGRPYEQARKCLEIIEKALVALSSDMSRVVRTRMFVTDISLWQEFGRAHAEFFSASPPVTSMVQVAKLIDPAMLIEIEAEAAL